MSFASDREAYAQGLGAYRAGNLDIAVPALTFAAEHGVLAARSYLARIYADDKTGYSDHGRAYKLFMSIVETHGDVDPDDVRSVPFVAHAWTALGRYARDGVSANFKIKPDLAKAAAYFQYAAQEYDDETAQFEFAKLHLTRYQVAGKSRHVVHWLAKLTNKGHTGAQALLADLLCHGKFINKEPDRALALISLASANASPEDRDWIEDIHQNIYCAAGADVRRKAKELVVKWRETLGRRSNAVGKSVLATLGARPFRVCTDGKVATVVPLVPVAPGAKPSHLGLRSTAATSTVTTSSSGKDETDLTVLFSGLGLPGYTPSPIPAPATVRK